MAGVIRDESGLFAVGGHPRAVAVTIAALHAARRRGATSVGLATHDGLAIRAIRGEGDPSDALADATLRGLAGSQAIGVVSHAEPEGPFVARVRGAWLGLVTVGRLTNGVRLAREQDERGAVTTTGSDAEVIAHLVGQSTQRTPVNRLVDALWKVEGAFAVVALTDDRLVAVRDTRGIRPLLYGRLDGAALFATEEAAITAIGGEVLREVEPGEMLIVDASGARSVAPFPRRPRATCSQEAASLARADSRAGGHPVYVIREALGERLAADAPCSADVVVPLDDAAVAVGYARGRGLSWQAGLVHDHGVVVAIGAVCAGARVVLTSAAASPVVVRDAVAAVRRAGALEIHVRIATPAVQFGCPYGYGGPAGDEPPDADRAKLASDLGADSVLVQTLDAFRDVLGGFGGGFCDACTSGVWPVAPEIDGQLALFTKAS